MLFYGTTTQVNINIINQNYKVGHLVMSSTTHNYYIK